MGEMLVFTSGGDEIFGTIDRRAHFFEMIKGQLIKLTRCHNLFGGFGTDTWDAYNHLVACRLDIDREMLAMTDSPSELWITV